MPTRYSKRSARKDQDSESTFEEVNGSPGVGWIDNLNQAIDDLQVNRTSVREESLASIVTLLTRHYAAGPLQPRNEELLTLLRRSLSKSSSAKESALAAQAIALNFISHGDAVDDQDELYQQILPALKKTTKNADSVIVKSNCLHTLGLVTLIAGSDIDTQLVRDFVFDLIETDGQDFNVEELSPQHIDQLMCTGLRVYGILFISTFYEGVVDPEALWEEIEKVMPMHEVLLESGDKDVRTAAGENVAAMFEILRIATCRDNEDEDEDIEHNDDYQYDNMDELLRTLRELSVESSRRQSKSSRAEQKSIFRDIVKSVEDGEPPIEVLKISDRAITFRGWSKILILNAFRNIMGQGLHLHLRSNDLLRQIFRFPAWYFRAGDDDSDNDDDLNRMSKVDRKYVYDENKKARSKQLRDARSSKRT
ncbi:interferon-related developmental regulator-domain-containing protein [Zychaea mexicana]|uniref:interferon-related developmental regulator-domain-containing protein n=1 Tax=Zychaea mexicana TaxID=64656 RepID=UPI0022FDB10D|nr:interferon-related developmental regulator-domain-containing protein [Zychaea mexicana]KAI9497802.1 interferon-related developmental regulator-domain-containing protein [Zychaea mexicana]